MLFNGDCMEVMRKLIKIAEKRINGTNLIINFE